jgi:hypothetical protein
MAGPAILRGGLSGSALKEPPPFETTEALIASPGWTGSL